jgi:hypothetical protein
MEFFGSAQSITIPNTLGVDACGVSTLDFTLHSQEEEIQMKGNGWLLALVVLTTFTTSTFADQIVQTQDGRKVLLKDDGTWKYVDKDSTARQLDAKNFNIGPQDFGYNVVVRKDAEGKHYFHGTKHQWYKYMFGLPFKKEDHIRAGDAIEIVLKDWGQDPDRPLGENIYIITSYDRFGPDVVSDQDVLGFQISPDLSTVRFGQSQFFEMKEVGWLRRDPNHIRFAVKETTIDLWINGKYITSERIKPNTPIEGLMFANLELNSAVQKIIFRKR